MSRKSEGGLLTGIREILEMLVRFELRKMLLDPTDNGLLQFFRYCFVGGIATVVDWGVLYLAEKVASHYLIAATAGFFCGLICNYTLSKCMVFNGSSAKVEPKREFIAYAAIGAAGLLITLVLMYVLTEWLKCYFMLSKVVATILVLIWNYAARRMLYH